MAREKQPSTPSRTLDISLDGMWDFTYSPVPTGPDPEKVRLPADFPARMPVPAYWDDELHRLREAPFWGDARFNPRHRQDEFPLGDTPPDATTPFLLGVGWYRSRLRLPDIPRSTAFLHIGGVRLECWIWVNGTFVTHHIGHSTAFQVDITPQLDQGKVNELVVAVANTRNDRLGTSIRGWAGFSAGITGPVSVHLAGNVAIRDLFVHPSPDLTRLLWCVELAGPAHSETHDIEWKIRDPQTQETVSAGHGRAPGPIAQWESPAEPLEPWSDNTPRLYELTVRVTRQGETADTRTQSFGLRRLQRNGRNLLLNGNPVYLRGATEHAYYPATCTPPRNQAAYRGDIMRLQAIGFNWLRFHTSVPNEAYMQAADQLGMMIQVEAPKGFEDQEWTDILNACRTHPSVVIYCAGNEECLDERTIERLACLQQTQKRLAPDALFNPQEALRGVEYCWKTTDFGEGLVQQPYPHNPSRLEALKTFCYCYGQYAWGHLSYQCTRADLKVLNTRLQDYERPLLSHEMGIIGNYLNLDLEHRYEKTRIGTGMFASLRRYLASEGLLDRAPTYYRNSCAWARIVRKHNIETARRCPFIQGYDFLGGIDCHWHRFGYPCGVLNEFYELKPGETERDILQYNGQSVLLCEHDGSWNFSAGREVTFPMAACLYGRTPLREAKLDWALRDAAGSALANGSVNVGSRERGGPRSVGTLTVDMPDVTSPLALTLAVRLTGSGYDLDNQWRVWVFPQCPTQPAEPDSVRVAESLTESEFEALQQGETVVLFGPGPFPALPTSFQPACAGRSNGALATVIADHPLPRPFPHQGFCDWQFQPMLEQGQAVLFEDPALPFDPIIEVVSSFKKIRKQAAVFEYGVGSGHLLVCALNLSGDDPGCHWFRQQVLRYAAAVKPAHAPRVPLQTLRALAGKNADRKTQIHTDRGFDARAQL